MAKKEISISSPRFSLINRILAMTCFIALIAACIIFTTKAFIICGLIIAICGLLLRHRIHNRVADFVKDLPQVEGITEITSNGFTVVGPDKKSLVYWKDVKEISLTSNNNLSFAMNNGVKEFYSSMSVGFYKLLQNIPNNKLADDAIKTFKTETFKDLETCKICGFVALKNNTCMNCKMSSFDPNTSEDENEETYIRNEQLDHFNTWEEHEKVNFNFIEKDSAFVRDNNWKPIVTKEEVIAFSKEHYWG